jgi:uncharacterized membrane protein YtjA (UPF0391 family)
MLRLTVSFLAIALISSIFGFGGIESSVATVGRVLFFVFLALFVLSMTFGNGFIKRRKEKL